jgi:hypothetical protein
MALSSSGNLMVGKAYTALLGLEPGDEFEIKLGRKQIQLLPRVLRKRRTQPRGRDWGWSPHSFA